MAHSWAMDCWTRTPRLLFVSPEPNCGKTTALEITQRFVPRAGEELVSNLTEAALYQAIEDAMKEKGGRPTILHDQLDKLFGNSEYGRIQQREGREPHRNRLPAQRHHQAQDEGPLHAVQRLRGDGTGRDDGPELRARRHPLAQPHHPHATRTAG